MKVSVSNSPMTALMFGKGFLPGVRSKGVLHPVNVSNGMPAVSKKSLVVDRPKRQPSRKITLVQR